jgi:hypothetical protein
MGELPDRVDGGKPLTRLLPSQTPVLGYEVSMF